MNYWHWGVNFNNHPNSHYMFMLKNGILIGSQDVDYQIDDLVAVHKGHGLLAIAEVTRPQNLLPRMFNGVDLLQRYGIDPALNRFMFHALLERCLRLCEERVTS